MYTPEQKAFVRDLMAVLDKHDFRIWIDLSEKFHLDPNTYNPNLRHIEIEELDIESLGKVLAGVL